MQSLKTELKKRLEGAGSVALLGVGSELRGDDAAGCLVAHRLKSCRRLKIFQGSTAPENTTGEIKRFKPAHLIIVDAADIAQKAGAIAVMDAQEVSGVSFCTHQLPMKILADYLTQSLDCRITIIGIQPKCLDFGAKVSPEARKAVRLVSDAVKAAVYARVPHRRKRR